MSDPTPPEKADKSAQFLDALLDALLERQAARQSGPAAELPPAPAAPAEGPPTPPKASPTPRPAPAPTPPRTAPRPVKQREPGPGEEGWEPPPHQPSGHLDRTLWRFLILVVALIVAMNVPLNRHGVSLARMMPDSAALVIRDGLVLKGSGPEIYILQNDRLRWISSLDAFDHLGLKWGDVHVVEDSFLERFEEGRPIHVLLKCPASPHIYRLENNQKRWIRDIDTFLAEGHVWEDVRLVACEYLRSIPDGPPIPEDAGPPPQP